MAKVTVTRKPPPPPVEPEIDRVTLELNKDEAYALLALTGAVHYECTSTGGIYDALSKEMGGSFQAHQTYRAYVDNGHIRVTLRDSARLGRL